MGLQHLPRQLNTTSQRLEQLATCSDDPNRLTRTFGGQGMRDAAALLTTWMRAAGLDTTTDDWGNVFATTPHADSKPLLVIGSHYDTVPDGGKFDGALGILAGLAAIEKFSPAALAELPFAIEIAAFSDEEGTRFQTTYLGSRAATGAITPADLARQDAAGHTLASVVPPHAHSPTPRYTKDRLLAYWEAHIEQGPVLDDLGLALAAVTAISGQNRERITLRGSPAHAGTCPMDLRRDALTGAAEFILAVEDLARSNPPLVATVGVVDMPEAASNVVPHHVSLTLDLRHPEDRARGNALALLRRTASSIAKNRSLFLDWQTVQENPSTPCSPQHTDILETAIAVRQADTPRLASGAGHDAVAMAAVAPVAMLFTRCMAGLSHNPREHCAPPDVQATVDTLASAIRLLAQRTP